MRQTTRKTLAAAMIAERYRLDQEMARGGMGTVWMARDTKLGRLVAIKVMAQELAQMSEALQRFEREATTVAQLQSTHVVEIYDYGTQQGLPYIVMELLEGENLGQRLKRERQLSLAETARLLSQICKGLKAAHAASLIHRDLKPSNIFIARRDDTEVVKLLDFGVVKSLAQTSGDATMTGLLLGTPQYMSPEQARATREIDHRSDLWSVAVIAFRMLTGSNPFKGESVGDVVLKICSDDLPQIRAHRPDLPDTLHDFFAKAFSRERGLRFQTADEMVAAFESIVAQATDSQLEPPVSAPAPQARVSTPELLAPSPDGSGAHAAQAPLSQDTARMVESQRRPAAAAAVTPATGSTGVGEPSHSMQIDPLAAVEAPTPVSTTVGGTQLASLMPAARKYFTEQSVAVIVGAAAALIVTGLIVAVWLGSDSTAADESYPVPAAQKVSPEVDLTSDDDAAPTETNTSSAPPEPVSSPVDAGIEDDPAEADAGREPDDLDEDPDDPDAPDDPGDPDAAASASATSTAAAPTASASATAAATASASAPPVRPPPPRPPRPPRPPPPKPSASAKYPNWGIGGGGPK